ncbi:MAG TPA: TIGR03936 family radical SAM-associated protein [Geothrix sp.]|nr:TIGR03936 family radical SAM-associated protein [Geothrix sp.]
MNARALPPTIPAEALARQARLKAALDGMERRAPSQEVPCLQAFRGLLLGGSASDPDSTIDAVVAADLAEEAGEILRSSRREVRDGAWFAALSSRLSPAIQKAQQKRAALWHLDTRRALIRFRFSKGGEALGFDDGDLHAILLLAFRLEGFRVALDLGKRPHPLLALGLPLPAQAGGAAEYGDVVLRQEPVGAPGDLMARLNQRLPEGLDILQWEPLPVYAAPVGDLAHSSDWRWEVPEEHRPQVEAAVARFNAASAWPWDRDGAKSDAPLDLRRILSDLRWTDGALTFSSRMGEYLALNPLKALGAVTGLDPAQITGLARIGVALKADPRLTQAERFEPKLKNMYEDAVVLGAGSNIVLIDEDDDEPLRLG